MGLSGVELTSYYFPTTEDRYLFLLKRQACRLGVDIPATAVGNNFCHPDEAKRVDQVQMVKDWVEHSVKLGAPAIRIFDGRVPEGHLEEEGRQWTIDCIKQCLDVVAPRGIMLALENHGGITSTVDQVLSILKTVDFKW